MQARLSGFARRLERLSRPRLLALAGGRRLGRFVGLGLVFQGVALALPVPVPFGNAMFALPIFVYGVGLLEDDGALIAAAHAVTTVMAALAVLFFWEIVHAFEHLARWIGGLVA